MTKSQDETTKVHVKKMETEADKLKAIASLASGGVSNISVSFAKELLKS